MATSPETPSRLGRYTAPLRAISARTGTPLPSLITSFAVLHELTAIVPFAGIFYACRASGLGERAVRYTEEYAKRQRENDPDFWMGRWMEEGEKWAGRVGKRYGIFGYSEGGDGEGEGRGPDVGGLNVLAGDGANALVAYCATKVRHWNTIHCILIDRHERVMSTRLYFRLELGCRYI